MKRGKREMSRKYNMRGMTAVVAVALILCCTVGGTLAWLATTSGPVVNTFQPTTVSTGIDEDFEDGVKKDVSFTNTSKSVPVYMRATLVANWVDANGNVYSEAPIEGTDYDITMGDDMSNWIEKDGYYYYKKSVPVSGKTDILFKSITQGTPPEGCHLEVTILSEAIQAVGVDSEGNKPVELAWGVDPEKLS